MPSSPGKPIPRSSLILRVGRLRASREKIVEALRGRVREHHRFMLKLHLDQVSSLQKAIAGVEAMLGERLKPFRGDMKLLVTIPRD